MFLSTRMRMTGIWKRVRSAKSPDSMTESFPPGMRSWRIQTMTITGKRAAREIISSPRMSLTLVVGGFWDQEDYYGALATYATLEKFDKSNHNFIVLGPWNHGGWNGPSRRLGHVDIC